LEERVSCLFHWKHAIYRNKRDVWDFLGIWIRWYCTIHRYIAGLVLTEISYRRRQWQFQDSQVSACQTGIQHLTALWALQVLVGCRWFSPINNQNSRSRNIIKKKTKKKRKKEKKKKCTRNCNQSLYQYSINCHCVGRLGRVVFLWPFMQGPWACFVSNKIK
jgi:hypothetical protein